MEKEQRILNSKSEMVCNAILLRWELGKEESNSSSSLECMS
jgi:hypothetical protein